jgi:type II secretory pathway component PulF
MRSTSKNRDLQREWELVSHKRNEIAYAMDTLAEDLPKELRNYLHSISRWFRSSAPMQTAPERPDVLATCLPLLESAFQGELSSDQISLCVRKGVCKLGKTESSARKIIQLMIYPILIILATAALAVGFGFWISPEFESMYEEFGIELPVMTKLVLSCGRFIRNWWWVLLSFPVSVLLLYAVLSRTNGTIRSANMSWLDQKLTGTRESFGHWAWHLSLLLELGMSQVDAFMIAGGVSANPMVRKASHVGMSSDAANETEPEPLIANPKFRLLGEVASMDGSTEKISLLRHVANYYWDRTQTVGQWWMGWLIGLILCGIGFLIIVCVFALFAPLFAVVSGLTGSLL